VVLPTCFGKSSAREGCFDVLPRKIKILTAKNVVLDAGLSRGARSENGTPGTPLKVTHHGGFNKETITDSALHTSATWVT